MTDNMYNFIYIIVLILGGATSMLSFIFYKKVKREEVKAMTIFACSLLIYMFSDFTAYYYLSEHVSEEIIFMLIIVSDILFIAMILSWIYLITVLVGIQEKIKISRLIIITAAYEVITQALSITKGSYENDSLHIADDYGSLVMCIMELIYGSLIVLICCISLFYLFKKERKNRHKRLVFIIILLLIMYIIWTLCWDFGIWYGDGVELGGVYAIDPLIPSYVILNVSLIYYFLKYDPLKIWEEDVADERKVVEISIKYGLSDRETEIAALLNYGHSNLEIAQKLGISESTVKKHVSSIFRKTGCSSRNELMYKITNQQ